MRRLWMTLFALLLFALPVAAQMGVRGTLPYVSCNQTSTPATQTCVMNSGAAATGDMILVFIQGNSIGFRASTVTDNATNSYSLLCSVNNTGGAATQRTEVWYKANVTGTPSSISITYSATTDRLAVTPVLVYGYEVAATPVCGTGQGSSTTASASVTVPAANSGGTLLIGGFGQMTSGVIFTAGANYTMLSNSYRNCTEYRSLSAVGGTTQSASCASSTNTYWSGALVAVKAATGGASTPVRMRAVVRRR